MFHLQSTHLDYFFNTFQGTCDKTICSCEDGYEGSACNVASKPTLPPGDTFWREVEELEDEADAATKTEFQNRLMHSAAKKQLKQAETAVHDVHQQFNASLHAAKAARTQVKKMARLVVLNELKQNQVLIHSEKMEEEQRRQLETKIETIIMATEPTEYTGATGTTGATGATGTTSAASATGATGISGISGAGAGTTGGAFGNAVGTGATGSIGATGMTGMTGMTGNPTPTTGPLADFRSSLQQASLQLNSIVNQRVHRGQLKPSLYKTLHALIHPFTLRLAQRQRATQQMQATLNHTRFQLHQAQQHLHSKFRQEHTLSTYYTSLRAAYARSNATKKLWDTARTKAASIHTQWLQREQHAHEHTRRVMETWKELTINNTTLEQGTIQVDRKLKQARETLQPWKKLLPEMKRQVENEEHSLSVLNEETSRLRSGLKTLQRKENRALENYKRNQKLYAAQHKHEQEHSSGNSDSHSHTHALRVMQSTVQQDLIEYKQEHGKRLISMEALDLNTRGLIKGKERLIDYQKQYQSGVQMYKGLLMTVQQLEQMQRKSHTLIQDQSSTSLLHATLTHKVDHASMVLQQNEQRVHTLEEELRLAENVEKKIVIGNATTAATAAAHAQNVERNKRIRKKKQAVIDHWLASKALHIARERVVQARNVLIRQEQNAKKGGVKMKLRAARLVKVERARLREREIAQQDAKFYSSNSTGKRKSRK